MATEPQVRARELAVAYRTLVLCFAGQLLPAAIKVGGRRQADVMGSMRDRLLAVLIATTAAMACSSGGDLPADLQPAAPADSSLLALIATPAKYDGTTVRVVGFCHLEFEGNALYVHQEDFQHAILRNAIWLQLPPGTQVPTDTFVVAEGTFNAQDRGHMDAFSGSLMNIKSIERWPSRDEIAGSLGR